MPLLKASAGRVLMLDNQQHRISSKSESLICVRFCFLFSSWRTFLFKLPSLLNIAIQSTLLEKLGIEKNGNKKKNMQYYPEMLTSLETSLMYFKRTN